MYDAKAYERNILGQEPWVVRWRKLDFGPNADCSIPTMGFMDVDFDPVWAQYNSDGTISIVQLDGFKWPLLDKAIIKEISTSFAEAKKMWRSDFGREQMKEWADG
jgi:hypothetical protein